MNKLSATLVKSVLGGKYGDGGNLWLHKSDPTRGKWLFYFTIGGKRREMGLGAYPAVSLKEVREAAEKWRKVAQRGLDPIKQREKERREALRNLNLFKDIALQARTGQTPLQIPRGPLHLIQNPRGPRPHIRGSKTSLGTLAQSPQKT